MRSSAGVVRGRADVCLFDRFWRQHNAHLLKSAEQASQLAALRAAYAADSAVLDKLEKTNVYNDAFCIGHDGVFGTINGLRLGRVPGVPVRNKCFKEGMFNSRLLGRMGRDQCGLGPDVVAAIYDCT